MAALGRQENKCWSKSLIPHCFLCDYPFSCIVQVKTIIKLLKRNCVTTKKSAKENMRAFTYVYSTERYNRVTMDCSYYISLAGFI